MVTPRRTFVLILVLSLLFATSISISITPVRAAVTYTVNREWVHIWINKDGSIDIQYNITLTYTSGDPEGIVTVGMPKSGFEIEYVKDHDPSGDDLSYRDVSGSGFYGIDVTLKQPIVLGSPNTFFVYAVVPNMVSNDATNPGNVGMEFYPTAFDGASGPIGNVRVAITLPDGVTDSEVKYPTGMPFDNVFMDGNNLAVYWERSSWPAYQELTVGVSFPEKYVSLGPDIWFYVAIASAGIAIIAIIIFVVIKLRKLEYVKPRISVEALGAARGLTAVEAAMVLELKPVRILTMILFGLLLKKMVIMTATDPLIKLQKLERTEDASASPLRYYEYDYLGAIDADGNLDETRLARTFLGLRGTVDQKLRGYSRADTVNYYKSIVNKAWNQVSQAGTPELKGDTINQNIEWLLADERFDEKLRGTFPPDIIIIPRPGWWWYWWGPHLPSGPTSTPTEAKPIPGQDFANSIVLGLEKATNNIVKNVQDFANSLVPVQTADARARPVRKQSSCVCACAHCACACACVSCACACAHGGAR